MCYNTSVLASSQEVSAPKVPLLPAPQANFHADEATAGTPVTRREASSLTLREAFKSRSLTAAHCSHTQTRSASVKSSLTQPQCGQVFELACQRQTSCTYPKAAQPCRAAAF